MSNSETFQPKWASVPGDTIADILSSKNISLQEFAKKMNSSVEYARELLHGFISINDELANKLEHIIGGSANFWIKREKKYRESTLRLKEEEESKWIKELPIRDMIRFGWIKSSDNLINSCLSYFNVPDVWAWRRRYSVVTALTAFRKSSAHKSNPASVSAWLRQGEIQAEKIQCEQWNPELFQKTLVLLRALTQVKEPQKFLPELKESCAKCGVAVVIVPTPERCAASGATKFITKEKALILLSFRYKSDDHFWFTFFHEAGHLLLHGEKLIIEDGDTNPNSTEEEEANAFSSEILLPGKFQNLLRQMPLTKRNILELSKNAGVSLGIIIGQLQHLKRVPFTNLNGYKRRYDWEDIF
jgi:HTH-type transcriptional regulator/antitoxin HigA